MRGNWENIWRSICFKNELMGEGLDALGKCDPLCTVELGNLPVCPVCAIYQVLGVTVECLGKLVEAYELLIGVVRRWHIKALEPERHQGREAARVVNQEW